MASTLAAVFRNTYKVTYPNLLVPIKYVTFQPQVIRCLYAKTTLGLDAFRDQRDRSKLQIQNISDKFRSKMRDFSADDSKNMIFTEDLKNMIHIAEDSREDIELVVKMIKRFNSQNKELRFGNFIFGTVVMRMFHFLNKPEEALECFLAPELEGFFDQLMSYQLLFDLLYENGKYQEMLNMLPVITDKHLHGNKYPKNIVVLTLAACYKLNTPESLDFALKLWAELGKVGHQPMRRAITFCAGLALKQGKAYVALEILSATKTVSYTTIRNLKVAALCDLGRIEDAIPILKQIIANDQPTITKQTFNKDVLERVEAAVNADGNSEVQADFNRLKKFFAAEGHISPLTLDEQLCIEISLPPFTNREQEPRLNKYYQRNTNVQSRTSNYRVYGNQRPGLTDIN